MTRICICKRDDQEVATGEDLCNHHVLPRTLGGSENRIDYFKKKKGDQQFSMDGRDAEITVDLVLQARAKICDNKENGPGDAVGSEMVKQRSWRRSTLLRSVVRNASWLDGSTEFLEDCVKLFFFRKLCAEPKKGIIKLQSRRADISDVEVVRVSHYSSRKRRKNTTAGRIYLRVGGIE